VEREQGEHRSVSFNPGSSVTGNRTPGRVSKRTGAGRGWPEHYFPVASREGADTIRKNATIDWTIKEGVRARLRVMVKRVLRKHGYPPDKQKRATATVIEQAELVAANWAT